MKAYAKIVGPTRNPTGFEIEYVLLQGEARSGQTILDPGLYFNEIHLALKLKQQLAGYLTIKYAPEVFTLGDLVLL